MVLTQSVPVSMQCPLCSAAPAVYFHRDAQREYWRCGRCHLVFVLAKYHLPVRAEKANYDLHENDPEDAGYRWFLGRVFAPLIEKLSSGAEGLDFGSGPGPTLSVMLAEAGFPTAIYDPFYAPNLNVWQEQYDFVTATEVVEHLHRPMTDLQRVWDVLKPGGWLGIMTKRVLDVAAFARWHYKDDPTHVAFFAEATFHWLASHWSAKVEIVGPDVVFLQKPKTVT
jgi:SAM-dependent methyltransferase